MAKKVNMSNESIDWTLGMIRLAIDEGNPEAAIPLIDEARASLVEPTTCLSVTRCKTCGGMGTALARNQPCGCVGLRTPPCDCCGSPTCGLTSCGKLILGECVWSLNGPTAAREPCPDCKEQR